MSSPGLLEFWVHARRIPTAAREYSHVKTILDTSRESFTIAYVPTPLMTVAEVEAMLRVSRQTVWNLRRSGKLPTVKIGKAVRFRVEDVEALIDAEHHAA